MDDKLKLHMFPLSPNRNIHRSEVGWFTGAGVYAATLCAILREYDSYCYGKFNRKDSFFEGFPNSIIWPIQP